MAKVKKKFPGIPQSILDAMGTGPEGLKNFQEVLNASSARVKKIFANYRRTTFNQTLDDMQKEIASNKKQTRVAKKIANLPEDVKAIIMANEGLVNQIDIVKKGSPAYNTAVINARQLAAAQKELADTTMTASEKLSENVAIVNAGLSQQESDIRNRNAASFLAINGQTTEEMQRQVEI
jgi:hypothetical protein